MIAPFGTLSCKSDESLRQQTHLKPNPATAMLPFTGEAAPLSRNFRRGGKSPDALRGLLLTCWAPNSMGEGDVHQCDMCRSIMAKAFLRARFLNGTESAASSVRKAEVPNSGNLAVGSSVGEIYPPTIHAAEDSTRIFQSKHPASRRNSKAPNRSFCLALGGTDRSRLVTSVRLCDVPKIVL
jgi:hypothetical protein